jgi:[acyl-carrier-protein] S-malonyltransferase
LKLTANTQPPLLTVSVAAYRKLRQEDAADFVAGHSLVNTRAGCSGQPDFECALRLVRRGENTCKRQCSRRSDGGNTGLRPSEEAFATRRGGAGGGASEHEFAGADSHSIRGRRKTSGGAGVGGRRETSGDAPGSAPFHSEQMRPAQDRLEDLRASALRRCAFRWDQCDAAD